MAGRLSRIWGIDAPKSWQTCFRMEIAYRCGKRGTRHLRALDRQGLRRTRPFAFAAAAARLAEHAGQEVDQCRCALEDFLTRASQLEA